MPTSCRWVGTKVMPCCCWGVHAWREDCGWGGCCPGALAVQVVQAGSGQVRGGWEWQSIGTRCGFIMPLLVHAVGHHVAHRSRVCACAGAWA